MRFSGHVRRARPSEDPAQARRSAVARGDGWVWPAWLERQRDPRSPAFVVGPPVNVTARNWTAIGNIASPRSAVVDRCGMVTPRPGGWSLDWWIGAEDRWHFPSREQAVRQSLLGLAPVVETVMRIPGGDAVARAYTIVGEGALGDLAVVEVENASNAPVAVAFAVRPFNVDGLAVVNRISLDDPRILSIDDQPALVLPRAAAAAAGRCFAEGDVAQWVLSGSTGVELDVVECAIGLAGAAVMFPLAHRATVRVALPLVSDGPLDPRALPSSLFAAPSVARAWDAQSRRGMRVVLPMGRVADAFEANRRFVLQSFARDARGAMVPALDRLGFHTEAAEVLAGYPDRQHFRGSFDHDPATTGAAIAALAAHWRLCRDVQALHHSLPAVALAARWIERERSARRHAGLPPSAGAPPELGESSHLYWDAFWSLRGLLDAAELLDAGGNARAAVAARARAARLRNDLDTSLASVAARLGTPAMPAGPDRSIDSAIAGSLVAYAPLRIMSVDDPRLVATVDEVRARFCAGPAVVQTVGHAGLGPAATARLAAVELAMGDQRALERLRWLVDAASPTWTWPDAIHPTVGGSAGDGHSMTVAAAFVGLLRDVLVTEVDDGLALLSLFPGEWEGQGLEVHDAPTAWGKVSFAVRWHGARPALLWTVVPHERTGAFRLRAPGLDATWSTDALEGEALLRGAPPRRSSEALLRGAPPSEVRCSSGCEREGDPPK